MINMGVMNSDNPNLIRTALDSCIRLDTAHAYMQGRNEEVIGSVIKGRPRDSYYISKGEPAPDPWSPWTSAELCGDCSRCPVRCPSGFDVKAKIEDTSGSVRFQLNISYNIQSLQENGSSLLEKETRHGWR